MFLAICDWEIVTGIYHYIEEYVLVTDLQGTKVRDWGSGSTAINGPGRFSDISSILAVNDGTVLVADCWRVQAFRANGSRFHVWTSAVCGQALGSNLYLARGCATDWIYVLDRLGDRVDVFELTGNKSPRFAFPVARDSRDLSCGAEEVYVINSTHLVVHAARDGTELRTLPAHSAPNLMSLSCSSVGYAVVLADIFGDYGHHRISRIFRISAADGSVLKQTYFNDHFIQKSDKTDISALFFRRTCDDPSENITVVSGVSFVFALHDSGAREKDPGSATERDGMD